MSSARPLSLDPIDQDLDRKAARFRDALESCVGRLEEDRWILAAVLVGSLTRELIWWRDSIRLWVIEADNVQRRRKADGDEPRIFRTLVEDETTGGGGSIRDITHRAVSAPGARVLNHQW